MAKDTVIHAQLRADDCAAELYLNDIPIARIDPRQRTFESRAAEEFIIPGNNWLEVLVFPGRTPSVARGERRKLDPGEAKAAARLVRFQDEEWLDNPGNLLAEVRYDKLDPMAPGSESDRLFPQSRAVLVDLGAANGKWAWQDAPELSMGDELIAEARAVLQQLADALRSGTVDQLWALQEVQFTEALRAYPAQTEAGMKSDIGSRVSNYRVLSDPVIPLVEEELDFRLVAGGRVLECVNRDWAPSLRLRGPTTGLEVPYDVLLARIDGKLSVVR